MSAEFLLPSRLIVSEADSAQSMAKTRPCFQNWCASRFSLTLYPLKVSSMGRYLVGLNTYGRQGSHVDREHSVYSLGLGVSVKLKRNVTN